MVVSVHQQALWPAPLPGWRAGDRKARRIHLIVDNYGIHSSHETRRILDSLRGRIVLHFLPPYCPDHNRIQPFFAVTPPSIHSMNKGTRAPR
jgi:DDE superfamily endonuclease